MTVISDVKKTMASLKTVQASFETFSLSTKNQQAKKLYEDAARQTQMIIDQLGPRIEQMMQEEPQYQQ
ncbi:DUF1657 domain-containing protein [Domibacillus indicus]|uniref:DUF1657 domain-containing protein n=1 Tax=Domibacillus indicus TaxID=1437523 RepID=UPI0006182A7A|nr:DUF1657 domain-containing protein [Domibacillus indicus]